MFFSYDHLQFDYEPFPIGLAKPLMEENDYRRFVDNYPPLDLFQNVAKLGKKYSLSERFNRREYHQWIRSQPLWREFHRWIKSRQFVSGVIDALKANHIDMGYESQVEASRRLRRLISDIARGRVCRRRAPLKARFEFSMLPADGGNILPHTDAPSKLITLIVSIVDEGEWDAAFGGGTDVNQPKSLTQCFNWLNRQAQFEDMDVLRTYEYRPNQAVIFVKTFNSWHSVRPMAGSGSSAMRRTLTINIEATD